MPYRAGKPAGRLIPRRLILNDMALTVGVQDLSWT